MGNASIKSIIELMSGEINKIERVNKGAML